MPLTIKDLISKKDYDYISLRLTAPENAKDNDIFLGVAKSENGNLIPLDGDSYEEDSEVVSYEEWTNEKEGINNGITIVVKCDW